MKKLTILALALLMCLTGLAAVAAATATESRFSFTYYYNNGSGDYYSGYVYAPQGWVTAGNSVSNQPGPMGGASLGGGYYYFASEETGYDSSLDSQEYITSYYDQNTGNTSTYLSSSLGSTAATSSLYVADRQTTADSGYAYDPLVPSSDPEFGKSDVSYSFSNGSNASDFLVSYVSSPYWEEPTTYANSDAEVSAAVMMADWSIDEGWTGLITTDTNWATDWTNGTANTASYVTLIGKLATDMGWTATGGTSFSNIGTGLITYLNGQGLTGEFTTTNYDVTSARSTDLRIYEAGMTTGYVGQGSLLKLKSTALGDSTGYAYVVGKGYWNNGNVLVQATDGNNYKETWSATSDGGTSTTAEVVSYMSFY